MAGKVCDYVWMTGLGTARHHCDIAGRHSTHVCDTSCGDPDCTETRSK